MLKIHTRDGRTERIDLDDENQAAELIRRLRSDAFQSAITGVSVVETHEVRTKCDCGKKAVGQIGVQYSISRPNGFRKLEYDVERLVEDGKIKGGNRVVVYADDACIAMMAHRSQPSARVTLTKVGKRRFKPWP